jgi:serine phosphatase RsbU (regulator of sigma subunit)
MVVGDVCGKGTVAATGTPLARYTLRAVARRQTRPSLILAHLNQMLLDWPTDDPRFLTAIYAAVRPVRGGARVRISSAGHPLALVRGANGHVHDFGRPGALLGVLARPELHDSQRLLRPGDSLIMFSDGVTEARGGPARDLYGDERLRSLVARLGDLTAAAMADAIQFATLKFSGGRLSDDTVVLVMKVPAG